jgi:hypothetical protein
MESVRQIVDSSLLDKLELPPHLQNRKVEIIIMPVKREANKKSLMDLVGILSEYANPDLISLEKEAWGMAMEEKHGNR